MICPVKWVCWSLELAETILRVRDTFSNLLLFTVTGSSCRIESYNPSDEDEVCLGARKSQVALLDFPRPWLFTLQLLFIIFKFPDLGVNHFRAITEINLNTENSFRKVPFSQPFLSLSGFVLILPLLFPSRNHHQLVGQNSHHHIFPSEKYLQSLYLL